jgi:DNA-binding PadR family transcriptional regulator
MVKRENHFNPRAGVPQNRLFPPTISSATVLRIFILKMLSEDQDVWGQKIADVIKDQCSRPDDRYGWRPATGQIYKVLSEMEGEGLLCNEWDDPDIRHRRYYYITDKGRELLSKYKDEAREIIEAAIVTVCKIGSEIYGSEFVRGVVRGITVSEVP